MVVVYMEKQFDMAFVLWNGSSGFFGCSCLYIHDVKQLSLVLKTAFLNSLHAYIHDAINALRLFALRAVLPASHTMRIFAG